MIYYRIPNWAEYQQYKDRDPTWIKLHKRILNNRAYMELPLEAKGLLPMMWILASESSQPREGIIEINDDDIAFRLRLKKDVFLKNIAILISACFITDVRFRTELYTEERRGEDIENIVKRREEEILVETKVSLPNQKKEKVIGTRLSKDWELTEQMGDWAEKQGLSRATILLEEEKFKDYWISRAGAGAVKTDWDATWRNWIRKNMKGFEK